jgi:type IV pilus assembly protein PilY1
MSIRDVPTRTNSGTVSYSRTLADAESGLGDWRTIGVSGFGSGQVSGGYFAIDLSNPEIAKGGPAFRWQLTRDKNGIPLFGVGGTPLITTLFLKSSSTDPGSEVAVAILPGGDLGSRTSGTTAAGPLVQPVAGQSQFAPSTTVAAYSGSDAARALTVVRLDTGEVVRSFRAVATGLLSSTVTKIVAIPAPIVGQPAAFPGAAGTVADRVFVGDKEGRIWRLDVSKGDPTLWTFEVFFDTYFGMTVSQRQPIVTAPVLSVDDTGQITLNVSTGDQGVLSATPNLVNRVISLTETLEGTTFRPKVNWVETLGCPSTCTASQHEGERVTGPMSLFGGTLYFATTSPSASTTTSCGTSSSRVFGLHYTKSKDAEAGNVTQDPLNGAAAALPPASGTGPKRKSTEPTAGVVFGVSIEQQPSCAGDNSSFSGDAYLGSYGSHSATSTVNPGKFFLVTQVGGGDKGNTSSVATEKLELSPPRSSVIFDSWAPIFE